MTEGRQKFPPVGDDRRFDAIVAKGRRIRRRRQALLGATTGSLVVAFLALVVLLGSGKPRTTKSEVFADDGKESQSSTTVAPPATDEMTVKATRDGNVVSIDVDDPRTPVPVDPGAVPTDSPYRTQQCVLVTLEDEAGQTAAEGFACSPITGDDSAEGHGATDPVGVELRPTAGISVGCAAVQLRMDPLETKRERHSSRFTVSIGSEIPSGEYRLTVEAVSGYGDGCSDGTSPSSSPETQTPGGTSSDGSSENMVAVQRSLTVSP